MYDPLTSSWLSPDPLAHKYTSLSPYVYCAANPVNFVDPDGRAWYYNSTTGSFLAYVNDNDDYIYLITQDQFDKANGNHELLSSYRSDSNMFGQLALEGKLNNSIAKVVIADLYNRANTNINGEKFINSNITISINNLMEPEAQVIWNPNSNSIKSIEVKSSSIYKGYDSMLLLAHEIGHLIDILNNTISVNLLEREKVADKFARNHWVYKKASNYAKNKIRLHETQNL